MNEHDIEIEASDPACREYRESISAYFDGIKPHDASCRRHVLACSACRTFEVNLRDARSDLAVLREMPVPDLWPAVAAKVARTRAHPSFVLRFGARTAAAAAAALATWGALSLFARHEGVATSATDTMDRALATIAEVSTTPDEFPRRDGIPELRLLAQISNQTEARR